MRQKLWRSQWGAAFLSVLLLLGSGLLIIGTSYGRYQKNSSENVKFSVQGLGTFELLKSDGSEFTDSTWTTQEDGSHSLTFFVSNRENLNDSYFYLRLAATLGLEADGGKVSLTIENEKGISRTYEGIPGALEKDSLWYQKMGAGYGYRFYDSFGEEVTWELKGKRLSRQKFTLQVQGMESASLMEVLVVETQQK